MLKPYEDIGLDVEYALGNRDEQAGSGKDSAYHVNVLGEHRWISYQLDTVHAGPDYPGYYSDLDFKSGRVRLPLWDTLKLNAYYRDDRQNLDLNPIFQSAPRRENYRLGLSYRPGRRTSLSLDYWNRTREDRLPDPDFDFTEETLRFSVAHRFGKLTLRASGEGGEKRDKLTDQNGQIQKYSLSASWQPTQNQSYRGYLQLEEDDFGGEDWRRMTGGLNASFQLGRATSLDANFQRSEYAGRFSMGRDQMDLEFGHRFRNQHKLSIRGRYAAYSNSHREEETAVMVEYEIPFGLPVSRKKSTGILKGRVYDAETQQAMPRAIVRLTELTAVTDGNGSFTFGSLTPGTYYLTLDRASIGMDRVMVEKSPMRLTIKGGKNRVEVGVTRSASVRGRVLVYRFVEKAGEGKPAPGEDTARGLDQGAQTGTKEAPKRAVSSEGAERELVESHPLANILVELMRPSETLRRLTDRRGRFIFEDVRPGMWTLKVYEAGLPEYHYLEQNTFTFELKPGGKQEVLVRVLPKVRRIEIIEEGEILEVEEE